MESSLIRKRCAGKWSKLLPALGVDPNYLTGKPGSCPICGGKDRFRWDNAAGSGSFFCNQCGSGDGFILAMKVRGVSFREIVDEINRMVEALPVEMPKEQPSNKAYLRQLMSDTWKGSYEIVFGDPVSLYLESRMIYDSYLPDSLRTYKKCKYNDDGDPKWFPAMLAKVVGMDGVPINIHRTYLTDDGKKAPVDKPRKMMPGSLPKGCSVRLSPSKDVGAILGIAEGIETAMSCSKLFGIPVWSAINARMLLSWEPPSPVTEVVVFSDNDANFTGQSSAFSLANRLSVINKLKVKVEIAPKVGRDFNDILRGI